MKAHWLVAIFGVVGCVPPDPTPTPEVTCGAGTVLTGTSCVPAAAPIQCGPNTVEQGGTCVPTSSVCAAGLLWVGGTCSFPQPAMTVAAFLARTDLTTTTWSTTYGYSFGVQHTFRVVRTGLSQSSATAWTNSEAAMVGAGLALHIAGRIYASDGTTTRSATVIDDTNPDGSCRSITTPGVGGTADDWQIHLGVFDWNLGSPTPIACGRVGSVTFIPSPRSIVVNVQLGDGTVIDQTIPVARNN